MTKITKQDIEQMLYDHTKTYNPSGKPTGVVMTDFDIMEAKQAIEDLYAEKLKAFAGEVEEAIGEDLSVGDEIEENRSYTGERIYNKRNEELRESLKAIKERWNI